MKKGFTLVEVIAVVVILGLISLLAIPPVLNSITKTKGKISEAGKKLVEDASQLYVSQNSYKYGLYDGNTYCLTIGDLSKNNFLPNTVYDPVTNNEISSDKAIEVTVSQNNYHFEMKDNCEQKLLYGPLIMLLLNQHQEGATTGLVKDESNPNLYYYKGTNEEVANNHLWYGGHHWRVIEFDTEANTITLISQQPLTAIQPASTVWTTEEEYNSSYINSWLNDYFWNSLDSSIQNNILDNTFNIGIYGETEEEQNVGEITTIKKVGLLDAEQYLRAGGADSFLDIKDYFWLGNIHSSSDIHHVSNDGNINYSSFSDAYGIRIVIKISDLIIAGGNGSLVDNYRVLDKATNTNQVQIGEYVNVPYNGIDNACGNDDMCLFRVVSKDSDGIKVVLNGLLSTTSSFGNSSTITINSTIYMMLNKFKEQISDIYRYTGNKIFYIGDYPSIATNYKDIQDENLMVSIGLPTVGEMFSGNDIDLSTLSAKVFVDSKTIENLTMSNYYFTMNRASSSTVRYINGISQLGISNPSIFGGVRPVIFLKNNLTFTGGDGTAQNPYTID